MDILILCLGALAATAVAWIYLNVQRPAQQPQAEEAAPETAPEHLRSPGARNANNGYAALARRGGHSGKGICLEHLQPHDPYFYDKSA